MNLKYTIHITLPTTEQNQPLTSRKGWIFESSSFFLSKMRIPVLVQFQMYLTWVNLSTSMQIWRVYYILRWIDICQNISTKNSESNLVFQRKSFIVLCLINQKYFEKHHSLWSIQIVFIQIKRFFIQFYTEGFLPMLFHAKNNFYNLFFLFFFFFVFSSPSSSYSSTNASPPSIAVRNLSFLFFDFNL